jgi:hypothetical protein
MARPKKGEEKHAAERVAFRIPLWVRVGIDRLSAERKASLSDIANEALVVVSRIESDRYIAELEFPVKTMNANERDWVYQTDTGPVLFPDLERDPDDLLAGLEVAYVALNSPDWADFIVRVPTEIAEGVEVFHFSRAVRIDGITNSVYRVPAVSRASHRRMDLPRPIEEGAR